MQNFHPLFVHFPIAFLVLAVVSEFVAALWRRPGADAVARWSLSLGALAAAAAALSGWLGSQTVAEVAAAHDVLATHLRLGFLTLGTATLLAFWRFGTQSRGGPRPRWLFRLGLVGLAFLLYKTAEEGGELVYEHGVGTELTAPGGPLAEPEEAQPARPEPPTGDEFR